MAGALSPEIVDSSGLLTIPSVDCSTGGIFDSTEESHREFDSSFAPDESIVLDGSFSFVLFEIF